MTTSIRKPSPKAQEWPKPPQSTPIVFAVQPSKFEVVVPAEISAWEKEKSVAQNIAPQQAGAVHLRAKGVGTWSFSPIGGGYDTFDDSDYMP